MCGAVLLDGVHDMLPLRPVQAPLHGLESRGPREWVEQLPMLPGHVRRMLLHPGEGYMTRLTVPLWVISCIKNLMREDTLNNLRSGSFLASNSQL